MPSNKSRSKNPSRTVAKSRVSAKARPKGKAGRKLGPNTLFVLSQPAEIPAAEVVKAAAERGLKLTAALVHTIRSRHRGRDSAAAPAAPGVTASAAPARSSKSSSGTYPSASAFVREQPLNRPVKEVVAAAERVGLKVTPNLVRIVRYKMRRAGDTGPREVRAVRRGRPVTGARLGAVSSATEVQFRQLVFELGVHRAKALVAEVDQAIQALISGR